MLSEIIPTSKAVIIIRHAEKPSDKKEKNLDQKGYERAAALAPYFFGRDIFKDLKISVIFAQAPNKTDLSMRPIETVTPTSKLLDLPINKDFTHDKVQQMVDFINTDKSCNNKVVLVCWEHHEIFEIASLFGIDKHKKKWHGDVFDRTLIINFSGNKISQYRDLPQKLLFGDSKH